MNLLAIFLYYLTWYFNCIISLIILYRYGIDRLVEDLIQESMAKGDFSNLKGAGKPLQYQNHNPFVDIATHKINQVLCNKFQTLF